MNDNKLLTEAYGRVNQYQGQRITSKEALADALYNRRISDEEAEAEYPGWYDRLKSDALEDSDEEHIREFAFPTRGEHWTSDYEIAKGILRNAERIEGLTNQKQLTNLSKRLEQLYIDISNFAERLESQLNSPDRV